MDRGRVRSRAGEHPHLVHVPSPRQPVGPAPQVLVVPGGASELVEALARVAHAGWQPWGVTRTSGPAWRLQVGRRD